ncbi:MAG: hypothetical protein ACJAUG_002695 [Halioglobus sp.]|jgi:hypothetical protein
MVGLQLGIKVLETRMLLVMPLYYAAAGIFHKTVISHSGSLAVHREFDPVATINDLARWMVIYGRRRAHR